MKNLLVGALSVLLIIGCKKQDIAPNVNEANSELGVLESLKQTVQVKNEMLVFTNEESYKEAIEYLISLELEGKDYRTY